MHPCGHLSMCETCAGALMEKVLPKCPICRKDVDSVVEGLAMTCQRVKKS